MDKKLYLNLRKNRLKSVERFESDCQDFWISLGLYSYKGDNKVNISLTGEYARAVAEEMKRQLRNQIEALENEDK